MNPTRLTTLLLVLCCIVVSIIVLVGLQRLTTSQAETLGSLHRLAEAQRETAQEIGVFSNRLEFVSGVLARVEGAATGIPYQDLDRERAVAVSRVLFHRGQILRLQQQILDQRRQITGRSDLTNAPIENSTTQIWNLSQMTVVQLEELADTMDAESKELDARLRRLEPPRL